MSNYRGSTGYGRDYMLKLRESWGIYDVRGFEVRRAGPGGARARRPARLVIMGGSAGGYTVLQSLVEMPGFYKAAICLFGVANSSRWPPTRKVRSALPRTRCSGRCRKRPPCYRERSPIFHVDKIADPIAVFQGEIDRVVPREQSDTIVASLKARGVPHEYHVYPGEGHGWRKQETIDAFYKAVEAFLKTYVLFA